MIYELLALRASDDPELRVRDRDEQLSAVTWKASQLTEASDFPAAARGYRTILESFPGDSVPKLMLKECVESPPVVPSNSPRKWADQPAYRSWAPSNGCLGCPMDQRSEENSARAARVRRLQILREFGEPPKVRSFLLYATCRRQQRAFVTPLIYETFPRECAAASVLTRFLRGDVRRSLFVLLQTASLRSLFRCGSWPFATQEEQS
jgi:hypothetical protein